MSYAGLKTHVVIESGIVPGEMLEQMRKWGFIPRDAQTTSEISSPEEIVENFEKAIEDGAAELRDTDLDAISTYLSKQAKGRLHVPGPASGKKKTLSFDVFYGRTKLGEYIIPWRDESIRDLLLDPLTYLKTAEGVRVHFSDVRDLFFGNAKAFIVCTPASD